MDTLIRETLSMEVVLKLQEHTKAVYSQVWVDSCLKPLSNKNQVGVRKGKRDILFISDNGKVFKSIQRVALPTFISNKNVLLATKIAAYDILLLNIYFSKDKIVIFDEEVLIKFSISVHFITVGKINDENENLFGEENILCFSDYLKNGDSNKKRNFSLQLKIKNLRFSHPKTRKLQ